MQPHTGMELKQMGLDLVLAHSATPWKDRVLDVIRDVASNQAEFTGEDVRTKANHLGIEAPHHANAWGAMLSVAARNGIVVDTGKTSKCTLPQSHARRLVVWKAA